MVPLGTTHGQVVDVAGANILNRCLRLSCAHRVPCAWEHPSCHILLLVLQNVISSQRQAGLACVVLVAWLFPQHCLDVLCADCATASQVLGIMLGMERLGRTIEFQTELSDATSAAPDCSPSTAPDRANPTSNSQLPTTAPAWEQAGAEPGSGLIAQVGIPIPDPLESGAPACGTTVTTAADIAAGQGAGRDEAATAVTAGSTRRAGSSTGRPETPAGIPVISGDSLRVTPLMVSGLAPSESHLRSYPSGSGHGASPHAGHALSLAALAETGDNDPISVHAAAAASVQLPVGAGSVQLPTAGSVQLPTAGSVQLPAPGDRSPPIATSPFAVPEDRGCFSDGSILGDGEEVGGAAAWRDASSGAVIDRRASSGMLRPPLGKVRHVSSGRVAGLEGLDRGSGGVTVWEVEMGEGKQRTSSNRTSRASPNVLHQPFSLPVPIIHSRQRSYSGPLLSMPSQPTDEGLYGEQGAMGTPALGTQAAAGGGSLRASAHDGMWLEGGRQQPRLGTSVGSVGGISLIERIKQDAHLVS